MEDNFMKDNTRTAGKLIALMANGEFHSYWRGALGENTEVAEALCKTHSEHFA